MLFSLYIIESNNRYTKIEVSIYNLQAGNISLNNKLNPRETEKIIFVVKGFIKRD